MKKEWNDGLLICNYRDDVRVLGYVSKQGETWSAFNDTKTGPEHQSNLELGSGLTLEAAKKLVEEAFA